MAFLVWNQGPQSHHIHSEPCIEVPFVNESLYPTRLVSKLSTPHSSCPRSQSRLSRHHLTPIKTHQHCDPMAIALYTYSCVCWLSVHGHTIYRWQVTPLLWLQAHLRVITLESKVYVNDESSVIHHDRVSSTIIEGLFEQHVHRLRQQSLIQIFVDMLDKNLNRQALSN